MELAKSFNRSITDLISFFEMPTDFWGPQWWNYHRINDATDKQWRFEMEGKSHYVIHYPDGYKSRFRLRKGSTERFYKDGYSLFAQKLTEYGTATITFTIFNHDLCDEENSVRWSD